VILKKDRAFGSSVECMEEQSSRAVSHSPWHDLAAKAFSMPHRPCASVLEK
jgi:hypothetical protein